jgi:hypothetical protein
MTSGGETGGRSPKTNIARINKTINTAPRKERQQLATEHIEAL